MAIIPAKDLTGIDSKNIIECFCNYVMKDILKANKEGKKHIVFTLPNTVYGNPKTGEVSENWDRKWDYCPYYKNDFKEEVAQMFRNAGYRVYKPNGCAYEVVAW